MIRDAKTIEFNLRTLGGDEKIIVSIVPAVRDAYARVEYCHLPQVINERECRELSRYFGEVADSIEGVGER